MTALHERRTPCAPDRAALPVEPGVAVREVSYRPGTAIPRHSHPWAYAALVTDGVVHELCGGDRTAWGRGAVRLMPAGLDHANAYRNDGARCLLAEIDVREARALSAGGTLDDLSLHPAGTPVAVLASRIHAEYRHGDDLAPLAIAGLLREMLVAVSRGGRVDVGGPGATSLAPAWVCRVRERLHDEFPHVPRLRELAGEAGVHPSHLVRTFRKHFHHAPAGYAARLRIERACRALAVTDSPLVEVALQVGFSDQAHFTRRFRAVMGTTPARYRAAHRTR